MKQIHDGSVKHEIETDLRKDTCYIHKRLVHKAYWEIKFVNFYEKGMGRKRLLKFDELEEILQRAYENVVIYKERTKRYHDKNLVRRELQIG